MRRLLSGRRYCFVAQRQLRHSEQKLKRLTLASPKLRPEEHVFSVEQRGRDRTRRNLAGQFRERLRGGAVMTTSSIEALRKL